MPKVWLGSSLKLCLLNINISYSDTIHLKKHLNYFWTTKWHPLEVFRTRIAYCLYPFFECSNDVRKSCALHFEKLHILNLVTPSTSWCWNNESFLMRKSHLEKATSLKMQFKLFEKALKMAECGVEWLIFCLRQEYRCKLHLKEKFQDSHSLEQ